MSTQIQQENDIATLERIKDPTRYNVIIHDNPVTSFEEVILIVSRVFDKTEEEAGKIAMRVHEEGKGVCGSYDKETAELKLESVDLLKSYLITNFPTRAHAIYALKFTLEEA